MDYSHSYILIASDLLSDRLRMRTALMEMGFNNAHIMDAKSTPEALDKLEAQPCILVIAGKNLASSPAAESNLHTRLREHPGTSRIPFISLEDYYHPFHEKGDMVAAQPTQLKKAIRTILRLEENFQDAGAKPPAEDEKVSLWRAIVNRIRKSSPDHKGIG